MRKFIVSAALFFVACACNGVQDSSSEASAESGLQMSQMYTDGMVLQRDIPLVIKGKANAGEKVKVEVKFQRVELIDHPEEGMLSGTVYFLLYKGDHYHLTILTDDGDHIWVDTNDIWDKGDLVGINIAPKDIKIVKCND